MKRRLICLLLVPMMLANQGLCLAHVHHGNDVADPDGQGVRPHFHVGGHDHHDSDHSHHAHDDTLPLAISPVSDHDTDAVYIAEAAPFARNANSVTLLAAKDVAVAAILPSTNQGDGLLRLCLSHRQPASVLDAGCPIYLRTLSLRL